MAIWVSLRLKKAWPRANGTCAQFTQHLCRSLSDSRMFVLQTLYVVVDARDIWFLQLPKLVLHDWGTRSRRGLQDSP
jgi:hypothetical protein